MEFSFKSKAAGEKARLLAAFEAFARENRLSDAVRQAGDLAIEEHLTNILSYGFSDTTQHTIHLDLRIDAGELVIEMSDDGRAFNPTTHPTPDLKAPPETRSIGGLGIHMIRQSMDAVDYARVGGRNVLRMRKRLKG